MLIRDPVHGDLEVTAEERSLLDTPEVQRLRGIRQLGAAYLVFPGAQHSRLEHALGTLHLAGRILDRLAEGPEAPDREQRRRVRAAALLHDVSHVPFGHTLEDERALFGRHDRPERLRRFLAAGALGRRLQALGLADGVRAILCGDDVCGQSVAPWEREVVSGAIDADLLDYLRRDAYYCGLPKRYDDRVLAAFVRVDGHLGLDLEKGGMLREDTRSEAVELLRLRYFLTQRVYLHHAKVAAGAMVARAVEEAGLAEEALYPLEDAGLLAMLSGEAAPPAARALAQGVRVRRLVRRAYVVTAAGVGPLGRDALTARYRDTPGRRRAEAELARAAGAPAEAVIVHCPAAAPLKEARMPVATPGGVFDLAAPGAASSDEIASLDARYEGLWRLSVFAAPPYRRRVAEAAAELFGRPNEYRVPDDGEAR
jgi:HD superfamily phosphohydrolase